MGDYNNQDNKSDNQQPQNQQPVNQQPQYQQPVNQQPQYQSPQYQSPQYQQPVQPDYQYQQYQTYPDAEQKKSNGMAVASLILGIVSFLFSCIYFISIPAAIVGLILGIISIKGNKGGKGMAIAGIILSAIGIIAAIALIVSAGVFMNSGYFDEIMKEYGLENHQY